MATVRQEIIGGGQNAGPIGHEEDFANIESVDSGDGMTLAVGAIFSYGNGEGNDRGDVKIGLLRYFIG